ncbi:hypothetical protein O181_098953 [Austropuccinia psidii MF-1]|uniref:Uncharacterized protein n=1 Tax=Austropuccinia psidii MF-1 TaxID=1389203 RepID=A0A9Q3JA77_9BASI|nr:hypothetical protein [Austropuccinia psidii MF-1]
MQTPSSSKRPLTSPSITFPLSDYPDGVLGERSPKRRLTKRVSTKFVKMNPQSAQKAPFQLCSQSHTFRVKRNGKLKLIKYRRPLKHRPNDLEVFKIPYKDKKESTTQEIKNEKNFEQEKAPDYEKKEKDEENEEEEEDRQFLEDADNEQDFEYEEDDQDDQYEEYEEDEEDYQYEDKGEDEEDRIYDPYEDYEENPEYDGYEYEEDEEDEEDGEDGELDTSVPHEEDDHNGEYE